MPFVPLALIVSALGLAGSGADAQAVDPARFIPLVMTVVRVEAPTVNGRVKVGTGVTVAPGVVVTNCHVTRDALAIRVSKQSRRWNVAGQYADAERDLCYLSAPDWPGTPVQFADPGSLRLYQRVVAMGFTGGADVSLTEGEITGLHGHDGGRIVQSSSSFTSGASGGALLDTDGRLVGILTFRLRGNIDDYFAVPVSWVTANLPIPVERFEPVGSRTMPRAFWEAAVCCVPHFMRVERLQSQEMWHELLRLTEQWIAVDPQDADAWFTRGVARSRLRQPLEATAALQRAALLAPRKADAWYELGLASIEVGDGATADRARNALARMNSDLAGRLAVLMPHRSRQQLPLQPPEPICAGCDEPAR